MEKTQQEELEKTIDFRNRELTSQQLFISNQKQLLGGIHSTLKKIKLNASDNSQKELDKIMRNIENHLKNGSEWDNFKRQFERIHPDFIRQLQKKHPQLTSKDLRHCSYLKMNLNYKEIARINNVTYKTVEMSNYRIKKKLQLPVKTKLVEYLRTF